MAREGEESTPILAENEPKTLETKPGMPTKTPPNQLWSTKHFKS